jgi:hypothetical protein
MDILPRVQTDRVNNATTGSAIEAEILFVMFACVRACVCVSANVSTASIGEYSQLHNRNQI